MTELIVEKLPVTIQLAELPQALARGGVLARRRELRGPAVGGLAGLRTAFRGGTPVMTPWATLPMRAPWIPTVVRGARPSSTNGSHHASSCFTPQNQRITPAAPSSRARSASL